MKELLAKQRFLDAKRREALNRILDIKGEFFCEKETLLSPLMTLFLLCRKHQSLLQGEAQG